MVILSIFKTKVTYAKFSYFWNGKGDTESKNKTKNDSLIKVILPIP